MRRRHSIRSLRLQYLAFRVRSPTSESEQGGAEAQRLGGRRVSVQGGGVRAPPAARGWRSQPRPLPRGPTRERLRSRFGSASRRGPADLRSAAPPQPHVILPVSVSPSPRQAVLRGCPGARSSDAALLRIMRRSPAAGSRALYCRSRSCIMQRKQGGWRMRGRSARRSDDRAW